MMFSLKYLPLITANLLVGTVIVTTTLAYYYGHVTHVLPYISDTGTVPPESGIFGQSLNIVWVLLSFALYVKYLQVREIINKHNMAHKNSLNDSSLIVGLLATFGISIVANFQETQFVVVHVIGAVMAFGLGSLYLCLQTGLYLTITPILGQIQLTKVRIAISAIAVSTFWIYFICYLISISQFKGEDQLKWKQEEGGFEIHNVSTISEWICATSIIAYLLLLKDEFGSMTICHPPIHVGVLGRNRA